MTPLLVSIDKSGDLKIGSRKCRLQKKIEIIKAAKLYNIPTENKTVSQLCSSIKSKAKSGGKMNNVSLARPYKNKNNIPLARLYPGAAKHIAAMEKTQNMNNVPLAKLYPGAAKVIAAMKQVSPHRVIVVDKSNTAPTVSKVVVSIKPKTKPTKNAAIKRIAAMKALTVSNKIRLKRMVMNNAASPARVIRIGREIARLR